MHSSESLGIHIVRRGGTGRRCLSGPVFTRLNIRWTPKGVYLTVSLFPSTSRTFLWSAAPLSGIRVIEFAGLAPAPYCGMLLREFGAEVIRVDRTEPSATADVLCRGKKSLAIDLRSPRAREALKAVIAGSDVLIDPFRPGVLERLRLGPCELCGGPQGGGGLNPRLVFARLTGWGQDGPLARTAGHDINYLAVSGALSLFCREGGRPAPPVNILADFAGGGFLCALGILLALLERNKSGKGQVIDAAMVDGVSHLITMIHNLRNDGMWKQPGTNLLDGGAPFYDTYKCSDGEFVAVGCLEPRFYQQMIDKLGLSEGNMDPESSAIVRDVLGKKRQTTSTPNETKDACEAGKVEVSAGTNLPLGMPEVGLPGQGDSSSWPELREIFRRKFLSQPREHWTALFRESDACVSPVLNLQELSSHEHNVARKLVRTGTDGSVHTKPAPRLKRTPAVGLSLAEPHLGEHSLEVLRRAGVDEDALQQLIASGEILDGQMIVAKL